MKTEQKESVEVTEEETNEYEGLTLEQKVETIGSFVKDSIDEIHLILRQIIEDHYEPDPEGQKTNLTLSMEQIAFDLEEIQECLDTLEAY